MRAIVYRIALKSIGTRWSGFQLLFFYFILLCFSEAIVFVVSPSHFSPGSVCVRTNSTLSLDSLEKVMAKTMNRLGATYWRISSLCASFSSVSLYSKHLIT